MPGESLKRRAEEAIRALAPELIVVAREIHANPELAFAEYFAVDRLCRSLNLHGLAPRTAAYGPGTSFDVEFGAASGPVVCIISEYDALPQVGHACGHNIIASAGLGAALGLSMLASALPGRVRYLGAPAEESGGGKEIMARAGAFEGVDCAMMVHPATQNLPAMPLIAATGATVRYRGRSAHASSAPEHGVNALDALVISYQAIAALRQHLPVGQRVHGVITAGGDAPNTIPELAAARYQIRAPKLQQLLELQKRVEAAFQAGALAAGATVDVAWDDVVYADMQTNWALARAYQANAELLGRAFDSYEDIPLSAAASSDMGNVSLRVPSIHPMIAMAPAGVKHHHPDFAEWSNSDLGMVAVVDGAIAMAQTAIDFMMNEDLRLRVEAEFQATMAERRLISP